MKVASDQEDDKNEVLLFLGIFSKGYEKAMNWAIQGKSQTARDYHDYKYVQVDRHVVGWKSSVLGLLYNINIYRLRNILHFNSNVW